MATLEILEHPDQRLRQKAMPVATFDSQLASLVEDMLETLYAHAGIGLAAPQVDTASQIIVCDVAGDGSAQRTLINPEIIASGQPGRIEETCLSVPGEKGVVKRPTRITVRAMDTAGKRFTTALEGLEAVCVHHEIDHLHGILFIDHFSLWHRLRLRKRATL
ncbi:MAG: peptide deformylase [Halorhodospira sp.]